MITLTNLLRRILISCKTEINKCATVRTAKGKLGNLSQQSERRLPRNCVEVLHSTTEQSDKSNTGFRENSLLLPYWLNLYEVLCQIFRPSPETGN